MKDDGLLANETWQEPEPEPMPEFIPVTVVKRSHEAVLVEFVRDGKVGRVIIPASADVLALTAGDLDLGIPWGIPWEDLLKEVTITPAQLAEALHNAGIWTAQDLQVNTRAAIGALQAVFQIDLAYLLTVAREYDQRK